MSTGTSLSTQHKAQQRTKRPLDQEIVDRIKNRAIEPQAVVALVTQNSSLITVIGEINSATTASPTGRIVPQPSGERLLDVITRAGGLRDQGQDTWVVLERRGRRAAVPFGSLIYEPGNNIWAWPNDTIYLYKEIPLQRATDFPCLWSFRPAGPVPILCGSHFICLADDAC
jgi:polysaccharide biosynthesis/export protein